MALLFGMVSWLVWFALALPALLLLLRLYNKVSMTSILWLIAAMVAWPAIVRGVSVILPAIVTSYAAGRGLGMLSASSVFGAVYLVESIIGGALLLTAVVLLERDLISRMLTPAPPVQD